MAASRADGLPEEEPTREKREKIGAKPGGFLIDNGNFPS